MTDNRPKRARRAPLPRTAPIRSAAAFLRPAEIPNPAAEVPSGVVERAVDNAYRVLEEQLQKGRDAAHHHHRNSPSPDGPFRAGVTPSAEDARDFAQGAVRLWSDMAVLWLDLFGPLAPEGLRDAIREAPLRFASSTRGAAREPSSGAPDTRAHASRGSAAELWVTLEINAPMPVEVTVRLAPDAEPAGLVVQPLHLVSGAGRLSPSTPSASAIHGATIAERDGHARVRLAIAQGQPAGTYLGMILDEARAEPCGSLRVVIRG